MTAPAIELDGRRLELADLPGDPDRPAVVLLHEGLGSVGLWRAFPADLAAATGLRVVAFSRFGHGASDPPPRARAPSFMHEEALEVLPAVLDAVGAPEPLLVGHSDGASIALIHAASRPVRAVVAMAPHVFVERIGLAEIRKAREAFETGDLRTGLARHHRDPDAVFRGWNDVWLDPAFRAWSIEDLLPAVRCPLLLVQGTDDQYGTMAQLDVIERTAGGPVQRVHPAARHAPHLEAPEATLEAVARFLLAHAAARRAVPRIP